jgi:hypothetical protein
MEALSSLPSEPPSYGRRADPGNAEPILTTSESTPRDSRALVIEQPKNSPEIPETPTVALEIMRRQDYSWLVTVVVWVRVKHLPGQAL